MINTCGDFNDNQTLGKILLVRNDHPSKHTCPLVVSTPHVSVGSSILVEYQEVYYGSTSVGS